MTFEEYLDWEAMQDEKWELVDGYPVRRSDRWSYDPITGMAGATQEHNQLVANLIISLGNRLRGGPCRPRPSDIKLRSRKANFRYPDVSVESGSPPRGSLFLDEPRVLFEVLSASNTFSDQLSLLEDYQATAAVQQIVWIEQDRVLAIVWYRGDEGWRREQVEGLDAMLHLPSIGVSLPMGEVYDGLEFDNRDRRRDSRRPA